MLATRGYEELYGYYMHLQLPNVGGNPERLFNRDTIWPTCRRIVPYHLCKFVISDSTIDSRDAFCRIIRSGGLQWYF